MKKYSTHIVWAVVVVVAFVGGLLFGRMGSSSSRQLTGGPAGGNFGTGVRGAAGGRTGGGFVSGKIMTINGQNITLQLPSGSSEVVFYSSSTSVIKPTAVPASTLAAGVNVMIGGTQNSDGSLTAQSIQVRDANASGTRGFGGGSQ